MSPWMATQAASTRRAGTSTAKEIELIYFNHEDRTEKVRLALVMTGTKFTDTRVKRADWEALKPSTPFGQIPVMKIDGKVLAQSPAMLRVVGKFGDGSLYPEHLIADIEEVIGLSDDLHRAWLPAFYTGLKPAFLGHEFPDDETRVARSKAMREKFLSEALPKFMGFFSRLLESRGNAFFCGHQVTIADLQIFPQLRYFRKGVADFVPATCLDTYPTVTAWMDRMMAVPQIQEWYRTH